MTAGHPRSFKTVKELQDGIDNYYRECKDNPILYMKAGFEMSLSEPLTVSGLASSLGVSRETLHVYSTGEYDDDDAKYSDAIKKAIAIIERDKVAKATVGVYDKTICIFDLKNNHGWKDQKQVESSGEIGQRVVLDDDVRTTIKDTLETLAAFCGE